jgi:hypothetical protein
MGLWDGRSIRADYSWARLGQDYLNICEYIAASEPTERRAHGHYG